MTASPSLWLGPRCASVSLGASAARTCELLIESPPRCAPSLWRFRPRDGRVPAADALCRALLGKDTRPACAAASSKDSVVDRPERLASASSPRYLLAQGFEEHRRPMPAISTNHEHDRDLPNLASLFRGCPRCLQGCPRLLRRWVAFLLRGLFSRVSCEISYENGPAELSSIRGLGRRSFSGLSLASAPPGAIARPEVGYPDLGDPDTFCRRRVARWAGGADLAGCLHILLRAHPASPLARDPRPGASLSQDLPAGRLPVNPREGLHVPHAQGAFHRGTLSLVDRGAPARRSAQDQFDPGRVGNCPQVVPSLWISHPRLFNPCRLSTF